MLTMRSTSIDAASMGMPRSEATAPTVAHSMTAMRTGWHQSHRALESSVEQFIARHCQARSDPRLASPNTMAKPSQSYGWRNHASLEALEGMIEPSSGNFHFSSLTLLAGGSRNSRPTKYTTGPTWSGCSRETSRGLASAPAIHGTSANANRDLENLSKSTLDASPSSTWSSRTSPTMTSFWHSSQASLVRIWCKR